MFTEDQKRQLAAKLDPRHVAEREQSGRKLAYVEGWWVIAEANRIFGFDAWTRETLEVRMVAERERAVGKGQGWGVSYIARVRVTVGEIVREGVGAGHGIDRDLGLAHESAIKESETDAMKRALMTFGNPFGLALYDKSQANVGEDTSGNAVVADTLVELAKGCETQAALKELKEKNREQISALDDVNRARVASAMTARWSELEGAAA